MTVEDLDYMTSLPKSTPSGPFRPPFFKLRDKSKVKPPVNDESLMQNTVDEEVFPNFTNAIFDVEPITATIASDE